MDQPDSFKNISYSENTIRIMQGPQFNAKNGHILALLSLACLISAIFCVFTFNFIPVPFLLIPAIILFNIAMDIRGIEINRDNQTIRDYKAVLWMRTGKFRNISDYNCIYLLQENVVIHTSDYSDHSTDTYHYYRIYLFDEENNKEIFLAEYKNFYKAEMVSQKIASLTGMTYKNLLKKGIKRVTVI